MRNKCKPATLVAQKKCLVLRTFVPHCPPTLSAFINNAGAYFTSLRHQQPHFMKLHPYCFALILLVVSSIYTIAQPYNNAIGAHIGSPGGVSFKHFTSNSFAIEGIIGGYWGPTGGVNVVVLGEKHHELFFPDLYFVYGLGAHGGFVSDAVFAGADGIVGLEYSFGRSPFSFMISVKPRLGVQYGGFGYGTDGGLTLRYHLN